MNRRLNSPGGFITDWRWVFPGSIIRTAARGADLTKELKKLRPDYLVENLIAASERPLSVQIENRDALRLIAETDSEDTLFYLDPPYVISTRTTSKAYSHEK